MGPPHLDLVSLVRARAAERGDVTAFTYLDGDGEIGATCGFAALDRRARALAALLAEYCDAGDRALIALPSGIDYIAAFVGCLYAGVIAVPAFAPAPRTLGRLQAIIADATPRVILSSSGLSARSAALLDAELRNRPAAILHVDAVDPGLADAWKPAKVAPEAIALLQYTSGSTADPRGVMVSHHNLLSNQEMVAAAAEHGPYTRLVGWLPLHHDMGLVANVVHPLYLGTPSVLLSPLDALQQPMRWLQAISRHHATTSGGPNFIYDLCVERTTPEQRARLDLKSWEVAFIGAEPVRAQTIERFSMAFAPCGFERSAFLPCYGLAEATVFVTGRPKKAGAAPLSLDPARLESEGRASRAPLGRLVVSCGRTWSDLDLRIVDTATLRECRAGEVGEIWLAGANVALGYWNNEQASSETFGGRLPGSAQHYLRTGDLGFQMAGELYVTGRLKDLIKVRGRCCYPQDIERAVENGCEEIRPNGCAAFSIDNDGQEKVVVVAELKRGMAEAAAPVTAKIRRIISSELELASEGIVLVKAGRIPRTSSGKIQRRLCRTMLLDKQLDPVTESWISFRRRHDGTGAEPPPEAAPP